MEHVGLGTDIAKVAAKALLESLSDRTKRAIDRALAAGMPRQMVLQSVRRQCGGQRTLTVLAVEEYLGADQYGRV